MPRARASVASENRSALPPPDFGLKIRTGCSGAGADRSCGRSAHGDSRAGAGRNDSADDQGDLDRAVVDDQQDRRRERDRAEREADDSDRAAPQDPVPGGHDRDAHQAEDDQALRELLDRHDQARPRAASANTRAPNAASRLPVIGSSLLGAPSDTEPRPPPRRPAWLRDAERVDLAVYAAIARTPTPALDTAMARLTPRRRLLATCRSQRRRSLPPSAVGGAGAPRRAALSRSGLRRPS